MQNPEPSPRPLRRAALVALGAVAVAALAAIVSLQGIAEMPFYTKGEPREALVVWEMTHGGGVVLPLRNGTEIPSKPPFFHWLALISTHLLGGLSEYSMRLPSALMAITAVVAVYLFAAITGRIRSGWIAATSLLLSFEWLRASRSARVDMTLTFFLFGALLTYAIMRRTRITPAGLVVFYACMAAATLGKGPVGIALPALIILIHAAVSPSGEPAPSAGAPPSGDGANGAPPAARAIAARLRLRERTANVASTVGALAPAKGLAAVIAITGAWYLAALWIGGNNFFVKQVLKENIFRVIDPERYDSGHLHGPLYFIPNFFLGAFPWSLLAPAIGWFLWRERPVDDTRRYLVVWVLTVIGLFSLSASKRSVYILSAYPAAALLCGLVLGPGPEGRGPRRLGEIGLQLAAGIIGFTGLVGLLVATGLPLGPVLSRFLKPEDQQGLGTALQALVAARGITALGSLAVIGGAAAAIRFAPGAHWLRASVPLTAAALVLYGALVGPVERGLAATRSLKSFMGQVKAEIGDAPVGFLCAFEYGAIYYAGHHIPELLDDDACKDPARVEERLRAVAAARTADGAPSGDPRYLLLWEANAEDLSGIRVLLRSEGGGARTRDNLVLVAPTAPAIDER